MGTTVTVGEFMDTLRKSPSLAFQSISIVQKGQRRQEMSAEGLS